MEVIKMLVVGNVSEVVWWERLNYDMLNSRERGDSVNQ